MKKLLISSLIGAGLIAAFPSTAYAHGGQYRGPGDVVPPNPGGGGGRTPGPTGPSTPGPSGPSTPGPSGPSTPGPSGPSTGGPSGPGGAKGPTTGGGGMELSDDLTRWEFWWEFNKDPFIKLKEAVHAGGTVTSSDEFFMGVGKRAEAKDTMKPSANQILDTVLPKLKQALDATDQRDITSSCMVAMAKIGKDAKNFKILPIFKERLTSNDQEIRETAALAMGISQMTDAVPDLIDLVADTPAGRKLCDRGSVDDRTRTFAAYGLGLVAYATSDETVKTSIVDALGKILKDENVSNRNIKVGVINAMGLVKPGTSATLDSALESLEYYYTKKLGTGEQLIQAHCPPAISKLLENSEDEGKIDRFKAMFLADLNNKGKLKRSKNEIFQSAATALGRMAAPHTQDASKLDKKISGTLWKYYQKGKDQQTTYFTLMALGQIGGELNRDYLMSALKKGTKALQKPWAAISLGVYCFNEREADPNTPVNTLVGRALEGHLTGLKNPATQSAMAIALGLLKYNDSADTLRLLLEKNKNKEAFAGYLCVALALMNDQSSLEDIRNLVKASVRRPARLQQAAIALGKLGDETVAPMLQEMMTDGKGTPNLAKMSAIASALGFIGDSRTISPLVKMLFDESLTDLSRAFAAVALGGVADKELLPWNSKISQNMNYRASVETLTNRVSGILDIL